MKLKLIYNLIHIFIIQIINLKIEIQNFIIIKILYIKSFNLKKYKLIKINFFILIDIKIYKFIRFIY